MVTIFTALLVVIIPLALFSPVLFSDVSISLISKFAVYSSIFSFVLGLLFLISSIKLSKENIKTVIGLGASSDPTMLLYVPFVIYLAIKQVISK